MEDIQWTAYKYLNKFYLFHIFTFILKEIVSDCTNSARDETSFSLSIFPGKKFGIRKSSFDNQMD